MLLLFLQPFTSIPCTLLLTNLVFCSLSVHSEESTDALYAALYASSGADTAPSRHLVGHSTPLPTGLLAANSEVTVQPINVPSIDQTILAQNSLQDGLTALDSIIHQPLAGDEREVELIIDASKNGATPSLTPANTSNSLILAHSTVEPSPTTHASLPQEPIKTTAEQIVAQFIPNAETVSVMC